MKSREYWQKRYMLIEELNNTQGIKVKADIDKAFRMAGNAIQGEIEKWLSRIADNNGVSVSKARQLLTNKELEEFRWDLEKYIKHGEENNLNGRWVKELENASARWHINRLEALKLRVQQKAEEAFGNETDAIDAFAREAYTRSYLHTAYEFQKGLGVGWNVGVIDSAALGGIIKKPWCPDGKNFSSRIWTRKSQMVDGLHRELLRTALMGEHPTKAIDRMVKYVDKSVGSARNAAGRLLMTEAAYFGSKGQQDSFEMLGVEEYEIVATLDSLTSEVCRDMDGKHFPMSEFKAGITAPPFHPYCRTATCPYFDDEFSADDVRAARNEDGDTYYVPADMKYREWEKKFVVENPPKSDIIDDKERKFAEIVPNEPAKGKGEKIPPKTDKFTHSNETEDDTNFELRSNKFVADKIASGEYGTKVNPEMQSPHMESTVKEGKSYLFDNIDPQDLFNKYAGTGIMEVDINGNFTNKELCKAEHDIGLDGSSGQKTRIFKIHHSKKRTHIVPKREK